MNPIKLRCLLACLTAAAAVGSASRAQEILFQEGFNDDGTETTPPRYTLIGREVYEPQRILDELVLFDQKGPVYWDHNFNISYVGNPTIPGRRAIITWTGTLADPSADSATPDLLNLLESVVDWLLDGQQNARIVVHPSIVNIGALGDHLLNAGYEVVDDDPSIANDLEVEGDLFIHAPTASNPSRFVLLPDPVLVINAPDYDDMLVGSIGSTATFEPGEVTIAADHPAAGGQSGSFEGFAGSHTFELTGSFLPTNAVTLATVTRVVPPTVASLADVDAMIAGDKTHEMTEGEIDALDFSDGSPGSGFWDYPIPGDYVGNWGLLVEGTLSISAPGIYRFALGSDDGARFRIDLDANGFSTDDNILEDPGPHGHQLVYANVEFTEAGEYDFQVTSYNSGGAGSLELFTGIVPAADILDDNIGSGYWDTVGAAGSTAPVLTTGMLQVTAFIAAGEDVIRQEPLVVVLNGPEETPPGAFYDGGPFSGFEGTGFLAGSGMNKWPFPDGLTYRAVQFNPVDVSGRENVRLTVALAATVVDFEDSDFIDIIAYPDGLESTPVTLAHFRGVQNAVQPWLADEQQQFVRRLTREFADFSYDIPEDAENLVLEIRTASTWWTETLAIDNVRLTAGGNGGGDGATFESIELEGTDLNLSWTGGSAPYVLQRADTVTGEWISVLTNSTTSATVPVEGDAGFFRILTGTSP